MATGSHQLLNQPLHIFRQQHQTQMTPLDEILVFVRRVFWVIHMSQMAFGPCCSSFHFDIQRDQTFQFNLNERSTFQSIHFRFKNKVTIKSKQDIHRRLTPLRNILKVLWFFGSFERFSSSSESAYHPLSSPPHSMKSLFAIVVNLACRPEPRLRK